MPKSKIFFVTSGNLYTFATKTNFQLLTKTKKQ